MDRERTVITIAELVGGAVLVAPRPSRQDLLGEVAIPWALTVGWRVARAAVIPGPECPSE